MTPAIHATAVAHRGPSGWRCVLLQGPSGAGKSDLGLRLMASGWRLVGDDYVHVWPSGGALHAKASERLSDRIEARGLGIVEASGLWVCRAALVVDCVQATVERMPEPDDIAICGVTLRRVTLDIRPRSAVETLTLMMVGL